MEPSVLLDGAVTDTTLSSDDSLRSLFLDLELPTGHRLLAMAEPLTDSDEAIAVAAGVLGALRTSFQDAWPRSAEDRLQTGIRAANHVLRQRNVSLGGRDTRRHLLAGLTAVLVRESDLLISVVAPGQAMLVRRSGIRAWPGSDCWRTGLDQIAASVPLGASCSIEPPIARIKTAPDDMLVLCSSRVGRRVFESQSELLSEVWDGDQLASCISNLAETSEPITGVLAVSRVSDLVVGPTVESTTAESRVASVNRVTHVGPADAILGGQHRRALTLDRAHSRVIEISEWLLPKRKIQVLPLEASRRASTPPGAGSVNRYRPRHALMLSPALRSMLPRGPRVPLSSRGLVALLVVLLVLGGAGFGYDVRQARAARQDRLLGRAEQEIAAAVSATSTDEAGGHLDAATRALDEADRNGASENVIAEWRGQLQRSRDKVDGVNRFGTMTRIGTLPGGLDASAATLVRTLNHLYLVNGAIYEVDPATRQLTSILSQGMTIDDVAVGRLQNGASDDGRLLVGDGHNLFELDENGKWRASRLPEANEGASWTGACGAFQGSFYVMDSTHGQVYKFGGKQVGDMPTGWVNDDDRAKLTGATDMIVDGSIQVLKNDGSIQTFYKGNAKKRQPVTFHAGVAKPVAIYGGADAAFLWVVERDGPIGRLIRWDRQARTSVQYVASSVELKGYDAAASRAFQETVDFVVDEGQGMMYFIADSALWSASLAS